MFFNTLLSNARYVILFSTWICISNDVNFQSFGRVDNIVNGSKNDPFALN